MRKVIAAAGAAVTAFAAGSVLAVSVFMTATTGQAEAAQPLKTTPLQIEAIAQHPAISGVTMSRDGRWVAALMRAPNERWPVVTIWDLNDLSKPPKGIPAAKMRPVAVSFMGNDHVLITADQPVTRGACKNFARRSYIAPIDGSRAVEEFLPDDFTRGVTGGCGISEGVAWGLFQTGNLQDPNRWLIQRTTPDGTEVIAIDVTKIKSNTPAVERVARVGDRVSFTLADHRDGGLMVREGARSTADGWEVYREVRNRQTGAWEEHPELGFLAKNRYDLNPLCFCDPDPNKLFVEVNAPVGGRTEPTDWTQIRVYDIAARKWEADAAFSAPNANITDIAPAVDAAESKTVGVASIVVSGAKSERIYQDDFARPIAERMKAAFKGQNVNLIGLRRSHGRAIVSVNSPSNPPAFYIMMAADKPIQLLGRAHPEIDPKTLGTTTYVEYKARDGLTIPAYLTTPPGYDKAVHGRIPLVVVPHGGPWARDGWGWDSSGWPQFLATRGYAVLQPQYRGSAGLSLSLWKAGDQKQWGKGMQDDKDDGAQWLVQQGVADPGKMAIFGYSYGGFAAIAASVRPESPYRCAIAGAGVADLDRLQNFWGANRISREIQAWTVGGMNPIENVDKANIPILLYHGDRDRQADTVHSRDFYRAMKGANKDVQYVEIKDMWHQLPWWPEWHRESLTLIENYLKGPKCFGGSNQSAGAASPRG